jgi:magnesium transporter
MKNRVDSLARAFASAHPAAAAMTLSGFPTAAVTRYLLNQPLELAVDLLERAAPLHATAYLSEMPPERAMDLIERLPVHLAAAFLRRAGKQRRTALLSHASAATKAVLARLLRYGAHTAGALLDPLVVTLFADMTAQSCRKEIRQQPKHLTFHVPVIDHEHVLVGLIGIPELMKAAAGARVSAVMTADVPVLTQQLTREQILAHSGWRTYRDLPVVDDQRTLVGVIRYETWWRMQDDLQQTAGPAQTDDASQALGELYWIGLTAFSRSVAHALGSAGRAADETTAKESHGSTAKDH